MVNVRAEIKKQIEGALAGAKFPIKTPEALFKAFPNGADTTCQAGSVKVTAGEAGKLLTAEDFPVKSAEEIAEKIVSRAKLPTK
jgi:hypothetical protein